MPECEENYAAVSATSPLSEARAPALDDRRAQPLGMPGEVVVTA